MPDAAEVLLEIRRQNDLPVTANINLRLEVKEIERIDRLCKRLELGNRSRRLFIRKMLAIGLAKIESELEASGL